MLFCQKLSEFKIGEFTIRSFGTIKTKQTSQRKNRTPDIINLTQNRFQLFSTIQINLKSKKLIKEVIAIIVVKVRPITVRAVMMVTMAGAVAAVLSVVAPAVLAGRASVTGS